MKKQIIIVALTLATLSPLPVFAQDSVTTTPSPEVSVAPSTSPSNSKNKNALKNELRKEIKETAKDAMKDAKSANKDLKSELSDLKKAILSKFAHIASAQVTANGGTTLTVTVDGKTVTVNITSKTKLLRHFWGKAQVSDIQVGDKINIFGTYTDDTQTTVDARLIRDTSIMKRFGAFFGVITDLNSGYFIMDSRNRGIVTVYYDTTTKMVNRKEVAMTSADLKVGDRVRVKGTWDKTLMKINEVTQIKDFSQPPVAKTTPAVVSTTPSVSVTPETSVTPSVTETVTPTVTTTPEATMTPSPTPTP